MKKRILVVEDDADIRLIVEDYLTCMGFEVTVACDGVEGLAATERLKPDCLILDLSMPKMDGWEVAQKLRKIITFEKLPILALTANAMPEDAQKALRAGCDRYLAKPFAPEVLYREVLTLLSHSASK